MPHAYLVALHIQGQLEHAPVKYPSLLEPPSSPLPQPAAGFGFGDAVIVELLKDKGLLPEIGHEVDHMVMVMGSGVGAYAAKVATKLRASGRVVDLVLEVNIVANHCSLLSLHCALEQYEV